MDKISYLNARELIKDGDIVFVKKIGSDTNWVIKLISLITGSDIYHACIAVWMSSEYGDKRLMCIEATHGSRRRIIPLSHYSEKDMNVVECPITFKNVSDEMIARVGKEKYSLRDFISAGLYTLFGVKLKNATGEICTEMIINMLCSGGFTICGDYLPTPAMLYDELVLKGCKIKLLIKGENK